MGITDTLLDKRPTLAANSSKPEAIDHILKWCGGRNKQFDNGVLDLRLALLNQENPTHCLDAYFRIKAAINTANRNYLLQPLEEVLIEEIFIKAHNLKTNYVEHFKIALDYTDLPSLFCAFRRAYHQVGSCFLCPPDVVFSLTYLNHSSKSHTQ